MTSDDPHALARRLKALRTQSWPGRSITQLQLAVALDASGPLISSWESPNRPKAPPVPRLEAYATFFATERSVTGGAFRLLKLSELTKQEKERREELLRELTNLRNTALEHEDDLAPSAGSIGGGMWHFPDLRDVTIVPAELPTDLRRKNPYADPFNPDYVELYTYADIDALIELHGHIRAVNPTNQVNFRTASTLTRDDYTTHLVLLGGVDWNVATRDLLYRLELPIRQVGRTDESEVGGFQVGSGEDRRLFSPVLQNTDHGELLLEDVALFYRGPNPFNVKRTVTICNGMFGRGTYGAVRALTDAMFRDRNEAHIRHHFEDLDTFSILMRVPIVNRIVVTPDWTVPGTRLYEWPEA
ncbi:MAG TPA: hypothetical protein DGG94_07865 [Micromonosporaceae bacterium]|nr:hypothetical protein [Micromonosporaceae bacterium]